jgi:hypothetical protein
MNPRQARLIRNAVGFFLGFVFIPVFGCFGDRPSKVARGEDIFVTSGQWISAAFYAFLPLFVMVNFGVWGFALLPLMVLVVARRLSATKGVPYFVKVLRGDISELLEARWVRNTVLYGTAVTLTLQVTGLFGLRTGFFAAAASAVIWGTWIFLAVKASAMNNAAAADEDATRAKNIGMLSKAFGVPVADWEDSDMLDEGLQLTITPPPMAAVLHYNQADSILALIAPQWEMNHVESDHEVLVLSEASEETKQRRLEEAQSGGLIAGKLSEDAVPSATPAFARVSITADELY